MLRGKNIKELMEQACRTKPQRVKEAFE